ncbi:MAG: SRPBCC family protein [Rhodospirillaceae bacterium]|nr:MAG: SRPBCC family protein [Rhodospirillaceae bacterium]
MKRIMIAATAKSGASPATVFALLKDGSTWPTWAMFDSFELERPGRQEPFGVGAIRVFKTRVSCAREEIVELIPDRRLSYILLSGFPFREYRADVDLEPTDGGGTAIRWRASFYPKYFGTGWFWRIFMALVLATIARQLASAANHHIGHNG